MKRGESTRAGLVARWGIAVFVLAAALSAGCGGGSDCKPGDANCACLADNTCNAGADGGELTCQAGVCREETCTPGAEGCACLSDSTCTQPAGGAQLTCHAGQCVKATCTPGSAGCPCRTDGTCDFGQCSNGFCVAQEATQPPPEPVCYSPCQSGLATDGGYVACSADGLMPVCLDGKVCTDGSCVDPGGSVPTCKQDVDCPDFQACIQGKCYANCESNADCMGGRECFRHVCRAPCKASLDSCPTGTACVTQDGDTGYCMPVRTTATSIQPPMEGTFSVSTDSLAFSSTQLSGTFTITNRAPMGLEFKVRKLDHTEFTATGQVTVTTSPLAWLSMGAQDPAKVQEFSVFVDGNGGTAEVRFATAANPDLSHWEGRVEVESAKLGQRTIHLSYVSRPEGRWAGKMYYFANFGEKGLQTWMSQRDSSSALSQVGNAFVQRWGALRQGRLTYDEFQAVVTATINESWKWQSVRDICFGAEACYLYHQAPGFGVYSDSLASYPIPSASSELPIAFNLKADSADPLKLVGKIVTDESLQYSGDPALTLTFAADPATCKPGVWGSCLAPLSSLASNIVVGGRYATVAGDTACARAPGGGFSLAAIPWLVPGFTEGTQLDTSTGLRYRYECRDGQLPFGAGSERLNLSFAQSNPIPDGRSRVRRLELVDGGLINQDSMFIIFRERFTESFLGPTDTEGFSAYGFMMLTRTPAELDAAAYEGHTVSDSRPQPTDILDTVCSPTLVSRLLGTGATITPENASALARSLLDGITAGSNPSPLTSSSPEKVHYLCHDTGLFDGGPQDTLALNVKEACPAGSNVTFFTTDSSLTRDDFARLPCQTTPSASPSGQRPGSCQATLDLWVANGTHSIRLNPIWRCFDTSQVYCDAERKDLREGKAFYPTSSTEAAFVPLLTAVDNAFRYKTQFRSRSGATVGFAPEICVPNSNAIPYCYDPAAIEETRRRVDCTLDLFSSHYDDMDADAQTRLRVFLTTAFGYSQDLSGPEPVVRDGFERLNAELLIMQGDEAYTRAFASRFDLAGSRMVSFQGSLFEPNGINLAGGAGNEMYNLYKAAQYYQLVLDRFYAMSPFIWQSVQNSDTSRNFVSKETVVTYFDRLIRASAQKARAWSEVAKRYQGFNRPDLARHVTQRAYSAAYLESIVLSRMILRVVAIADPADRAFITSRAELAALGYRASLLDMREVYAGIHDEPTFFGDAPDFIPFPALEPGDVNAFAKLLAAAKQSMSIAATKEEAALASNRAFDTDAAQFQTELIRIRNNYESQLGDICGTFRGSDGLVHPATRTYAYLDEQTKLMGDPCGLVGNGRLHDAMATVELTQLDMRAVSGRYDNLDQEIALEKKRVESQCSLNVDLAKYRFDLAGKVMSAQDVIRNSRATQGVLDRASQHAEVYANLAKCVVGAMGTDCATGAAALLSYAGFTTGADLAIVGLDVLIDAKEDEIAQLQQAAGTYELEHQCEVMRVDSKATVDKLLLEYALLDLEALKTAYRLKLDVAQIHKLRNEATRLLAEKEEMEQQTINVEAARNDPNVRIYKNDAVLLADQTFTRALQDAYRATRVFEYYTSQSYAKLGELFLIRMVSHGDYNLETYLTELEAAYRDFQQRYGNPDTRVDVVSLRDDVLAIPRLDAKGRSLSQAERTALFREKLTSAAYIDERGYVSLPFSTSLSRLSPLTRNHKLLAVEAEVIGVDLGDTVGRLYVRQRGTGMVQSVDGAKNYYRFPERTAVLNPFFNGVRVFTPEVYRSDRLRDRPFVNTHWELVINQKDELANKDINLQSLTDIRLYVYYSDFTRL